VVVRNFNEGIDNALNGWLADLPTPNKLWVFKCDQAEADVDPTMVLADLTKTAATAAIGRTGLACAARVIDLGSFTFPETTDTTARSIVVSTDDPANVGAKVVFIEDITDGSPWDSTVNGPMIHDGLSFINAYFGEF
jgi:hypothetical protein